MCAQTSLPSIGNAPGSAISKTRGKAGKSGQRNKGGFISKMVVDGTPRADGTIHSSDDQDDEQNGGGVLFIR